ncbi:hypothetical protein HPB50_000231 [Hyalomma asiaticum]|uniref:Uncharacterized protein n=1 Tax=Hyalomma asiaticum TaxID=266040 RepID=A0ACB7SD92_HYAAI|nr:hypothetical protein HPB50_000231 [Hyalomma asiaticum]
MFSRCPFCTLVAGDVTPVAASPESAQSKLPFLHRCASTTKKQLPSSSTGIPTRHHGSICDSSNGGLDILFASQVHLGSGVYVGEQQWAWLLSRPKDSLFCKETTKALWGVAQLRNRSLTGAPCRRFARQENQGPPRRALTPLKLGAVANAFAEYVRRRPMEVPAPDRLKKRNRFIAEMLNDLNK